ncbi:fructosamine kinase family protein [Chitinophaga rhizophila]|uniref:Fructosamine kinase family protein n=1 Tax=Chitinophaga rhizophila TaxID=2866212 RepID=A0ABS7G8E4_9BACT|nr:fructosamine kinase family protein [Chitinophaga rhizophila]MBW8682967.1 fructosamine kinase family protein [Chitinophaga rhizophila]
MQKDLLLHLESVLTTYFQMPVFISQVHAAGGGDINDSFVLDTSQGPLFIKLNDTRYEDMFTKESNGLQLLGTAKALRVPTPYCYGSFQQYAYLLMEYLPGGRPAQQSIQQLAEGLATLHRCSSEQFGLQEDNYIGTLRQHNKQTSSWGVFYGQYRILPLVRQLIDIGHFGDKDLRQTDSLVKRLEDMFPEEVPALLHGDLWSGNYMFTVDGQPAIYDPAVYYGHREMDIAMTRLFGGFDASFYEHYQSAFPMVAGWQDRVPLFQLYPVLVHAVLFGGQYITQSARIIAQYS